MARWEFKLPDIGEGVTEGEIVGWLIKPGDAVREDQPMIEVMTDKATVTITAPKAGTVVETRGKVGEVVPVHSVLVVFELGGAAPSANANGTNGSNAHAHLADGPAATAVGSGCWCSACSGKIGPSNPCRCSARLPCSSRRSTA